MTMIDNKVKHNELTMLLKAIKRIQDTEATCVEIATEI